MSSPRQIAFYALRDVHKGGFVDVALDRILQKVKLSDQDRRLVTELVYGCVRRQRTLDFIIDQIGKKRSHQQPKDLRTILHLGLYQLCFKERIPPSAAVNTTVELAKTSGFEKLSGVVNGMLRQYIRLIEGVGRDGGDKGDEEDKGDRKKYITDSSPSPPSPPSPYSLLPIPHSLPPIERLGILHSFPDWIVEVWVEQFGLAETEKLCEWMNQTPTIDLRVNRLRVAVEEVEKAFQDAGVEFERLPYLPQALRLIGSNGAIKDLPGFNQGWWTVQDSSAQLVGYLLDPQPGEVIIDACAAPGGKTTHTAELMQDKGKIWACDRTASRLRKLEENASRLQLKSIQVCIGDSRNFPQFQNTADRVLIDAPCSGLGTLNRHADARWRQTPQSVAELTTLQKELIFHASTFVKPGGVVVYATCTLHPAENEAVVESFLTANPTWEIEPPTPDSPASMFTTPQGSIKVLPHQHKMDGFFMVRLRKTNYSK